MYFGFQDITIAFGAQRVLNGVTLNIPQGKIVTIIGQNGCGKSSLLKTVSKAVTPQSGLVIYRDRPLSSYPPRFLAQHIAYLAQVHPAPPDIDVRTLVSYGRYPYVRFGSRLSREDGAVIDRALKLTGLEPLAHRALSTLSGGERQRAWIAMAVCQQPEILIMDEPVTYLDVGYQLEVLELARQLNRELGMTILLVLHDLNMAARYSDLLCALRDGRVDCFGPPEEVLCDAVLERIFHIRAEIGRDAAYHCPYLIPLNILPGTGNESSDEPLLHH